MPFLQFYPGDHLAEQSLELCSLAAQGLWTRMLCYMHRSPERGVLLLDSGEQPSEQQLARLCRTGASEIRELLAELEGEGVFSRRDDGAVFCRRMYRKSKAAKRAADARWNAEGDAKPDAPPDADEDAKPDAPPDADEDAPVDADRDADRLLLEARSQRLDARDQREDARDARGVSPPRASGPEDDGRLWSAVLVLLDENPKIPRPRLRGADEETRRNIAKVRRAVERGTRKREDQSTPPIAWWRAVLERASSNAWFLGAGLDVRWLASEHTSGLLNGDRLLKGHHDPFEERRPRRGASEAIQAYEEAVKQAAKRADERTIPQDPRAERAVRRIGYKAIGGVRIGSPEERALRERFVQAFDGPKVVEHRPDTPEDLEVRGLFAQLDEAAS